MGALPMAAIRRLVLAGAPRKGAEVAQRRRECLRELLGNPDLSHVGAADVRNAWEHADERIDDFVPRLQVGDIVSQLHVSARQPGPRTYAMRRFDPNTLTLHFLDVGIPLREASVEIADLRTRLDAAWVRLHTEVVRPWG
jgi:hypothetical protein